MQLPFLKALRRLYRNRRDLAALKTWDEKDEERKVFYANFVGPDDLVFDVGANIGNRAKIFSRIARRVVLFEPQPYCLSVLTAGFASDDKISIVSKALGSEIGSAEIALSDAHTVSSMSRQWVAAVQKSGRFNHISWDRAIEVRVTTLDAAIEEFGEPAFIKIDVEGYEAEVLAGLSRPINTLSMEFTPEHLVSIRTCLEKLDELGQYEYSFSLGESMQLDGDSWSSSVDLLEKLANCDHTTFGDVYARRSPS